MRMPVITLMPKFWRLLTREASGWKKRKEHLYRDLCNAPPISSSRARPPEKTYTLAWRNNKTAHILHGSPYIGDDDRSGEFEDPCPQYMLNAHAETKNENNALQPGASREIGDKWKQGQ